MEPTLFDKLAKADTNSLVKKHLSRQMYDALKDKKTPSGGDFDICIRSGVENLDSIVGLYACDPTAYTTFSDLFDPVIRDFHKVPVSQPIQQPPLDLGDTENLPFDNPDPDGKYVLSTRVRVARCHAGYGFPPTLTREQRLEMERRTCEAFEKLPDSLRGTYYSLVDMTPEVQNQLVQDHFLFHDHSKFRRSVGGYNDWPVGRGIFFNKDKNFLVWVNEGDHLRFISMETGGDLKSVYKRLVTGIRGMEESLTFSRDDRLGYLTFCPSNLGTTLRASVHIRIPHVSTHPSFSEICDKFDLQARGIHGEHTESEGGVYDISNVRRLGLTEINAVTDMYNGVKALIKLESELSETE